MCKICKSSHKYTRNISYLTEPIDVFSDWLDTLAGRGSKKLTAAAAAKKRQSQQQAQAKKGRYEDEDDEDEEEKEDEKSELTPVM